MVKRLVAVRRSARYLMSMDGPAHRSPSVGGRMPARSFAHALPRAVGPDYPEALAARDRQVNLDEHRVSSKALRLEFDHLCPPLTLPRNSSPILRRSSTGRSTLSMRSIWRCLLRACLM